MNPSAAAGCRKAGVLIKTTLVDYPGHVASAVFLHGCNLRCPYCYNTELVNGAPDDVSGAVTQDEIISHLEKRKNVLSGLVISGGEPLLSPFLVPLIRAAKSAGYLVKLDTNGTNPEKLSALLSDSTLRPDFIAMDLKTSPVKTHMLLPEGSDTSLADRMNTSISRTISILSELPPETREFRTVLVPPLVDHDDIRQMASLLPADADWKFAEFRNEGCLNAGYQSIPPYTQKETVELVSLAGTLIPGAVLR